MWRREFEDLKRRSEANGKVTEEVRALVSRGSAATCFRFQPPKRKAPSEWCLFVCNRVPGPWFRNVSLLCFQDNLGSDHV